MNRREVLKAMALGAAGLAIGPGCQPLGRLAAADSRPGKRPNIVFFLADDHGQADSGCYGNPVIRTPNIDRLAREGVRFTRAFTPSPQCAPSRSAVMTGLYPFRNGAHPNHKPILPGIKTLPSFFLDMGYRVVHEGKTHLAPKESFPFESKWDGGVIGWERIDALLADPGDKPLFLSVSSHRPHKPWPHVATYDPAKVVVPPWIDDTPDSRSQLARYYTYVDDLDGEIGRLLDMLDKHKMAEDTIFVYGSDHGIQFPHSKWELYDPGIRIPLIFRWPGRIKPGTTTDAMVSYVDLLPTWMEAAGAKPPKDIDGQSFLAVLEGRTGKHRDRIFATHTRDIGPQSGTYFSDFPMRAIRTETHKLILNLTTVSGGLNRDTRVARKVEGQWVWPKEELYDLRTDPAEMKNIANDPAQKATLDGLRKELVALCAAQGDRMDDKIMQRASSQKAG